MERMYRSFLFALSIVGFLGVAASADLKTGQDNKTSDKSLVEMIKDIHLAQEANVINNNKWNLDVANINEDGLSKVEQLLSEGETPFDAPVKQ